MKYFKLLIFLMQILISLNGIHGIKISKHDEFKNFKSNNQHKIKIVHYALKDEDSIRIKTVPVKILQIEPYSNWVAKGIWIGDNYNQTG